MGGGGERGGWGGLASGVWGRGSNSNVSDGGADPSGEGDAWRADWQGAKDCATETFGFFRGCDAHSASFSSLSSLRLFL